jgi:hypothetical protein
MRSRSLPRSPGANMPRTVAFSLPTDTAQFTALQLQPKSLLSLSFSALARWLREHLVSFPDLIRRHGYSLVILGANIRYEQPLGFFDCDELYVEAALRVLRHGKRVKLDVTFRGGEARGATVGILFCPVHIDDTLSLGASPQALSDALLARFQPDEIDSSASARPVRDLLRRMEGSAEQLAHVEGPPFVIHRHMCEVADQWAFLEVPALTGGAREGLAMENGGQAPLLTEGLRHPLRSFDMELSRPYFWFQEGTVETTAYRWDDHLTFVHRLLSKLPGEKVHGIIIEQF